MNQAYLNSVQLLLAEALSVFRRAVFALKGSPAINLFLLDMPLLSMDLDLVFTEHRSARNDDI